MCVSLHFTSSAQFLHFYYMMYDDDDDDDDGLVSSALSPSPAPTPVQLSLPLQLSLSLSLPLSPSLYISPVLAFLIWAQVLIRPSRDTTSQQAWLPSMPLCVSHLQQGRILQQIEPTS